MVSIIFVVVVREKCLLILCLIMKWIIKEEEICISAFIIDIIPYDVIIGRPDIRKYYVLGLKLYSNFFDVHPRAHKASNYVFYESIILETDASNFGIGGYYLYQLVDNVIRKIWTSYKRCAFYTENGS